MRITVSIILLMLFYSGVGAQWQQTGGGFQKNSKTITLHPVELPNNCYRQCFQDL